MDLDQGKREQVWEIFCFSCRYWNSTLASWVLFCKNFQNPDTRNQGCFWQNKISYKSQSYNLTNGVQKHHGIKRYCLPIYVSLHFWTFTRQILYWSVLIKSWDLVRPHPNSRNGSIVKLEKEHYPAFQLSPALPENKIAAPSLILKHSPMIQGVFLTGSKKLI